MTKTLRRTTIAFAALAALTAVVGAGAGTSRAHGPQLTVRWQAPTPRDGAAFSVKAGEPLSIELAAAPGSVIRSRQAARAGRVRGFGRAGEGRLDAVGEPGRRAHAHVRRSERQPLRPSAKLPRLRPAGDSGRAPRRVPARRGQRHVALRGGLLRRLRARTAEQPREEADPAQAVHAGRDGERRSRR